ncbi:hypothetical protein GCM10027085_41440 [Spirosoma aerophilum]
MAWGLSYHRIATLVGVDGIIGQKIYVFLKERHHLNRQRKYSQPIYLLMRKEAPQRMLPDWMAPGWIAPGWMAP